MSYDNITIAYLSRWLAEADALDLVIFRGCVNEFPATDDRTRELKSPNTLRIDVGSSSVILVSVSRGEYIEIFRFFFIYARKLAMIFLIFICQWHYKYFIRLGCKCIQIYIKINIEH